MNPIFASDLVRDDGEFSKLRGQLEELEKVYTRVLNKSQEEAIQLRAKIVGLNETQATQQKAIRDVADQTDELVKRNAKYQDSLTDNAKKIAEVKLAQQELNRVNRLEAKLNKAKKGSYDQLSAQYSLLKIKINALSKEERENTKAGREMVETSREIYEEMKRLQAETGKTSLNVGNYADALRDIPGPAGAVVDSVGNIGKSLKALLANPIVLFIAAIVGALAALTKAFFRSEDGAQLMAKATGILNAAMGQLTDIAVSVKDGLVEAFNNPKETIQDLGQLLVDQILNRLKAIPLIGKAALDALKALWNRDMDALKQAGEDAFFAVNQAISGLDKEDQLAIADAIRETVDEIKEETNAWIALEEARLRVARSNRSLVRTIEELTTAEETAQAVVDDTTRSFKEREEAAERAREAIEARSNAEIQLAKNNLSLINQEISLRRANRESVADLLDQQLAAFRELATAERQYTVAVLNNERERSELKQDRLERDLDILLDGFDNQKTINERLLQDDKLTFDKRRQIFEETVRLSDESFAKQIETIQQFTGIAVDANDLIATSDAVALNQKIRNLGLSEIIEGRLLEIIRDRRTAVQDLSEAEVELAERQAKFAKAEEDRRLKELSDRRKAEQEKFDQQQDLAQSEFDLLERNEEQKQIFTLNAERERLQKVIDINEEFAGELTEVQLQTLRNQIDRINQEIDNIAKDRSIYDLLGIDVSAEQKAGIKNVFDSVKQAVVDFYAFRKEIADRNVERANQELDVAQRNLQIELENQKNNFDARVELRERELQDARRAQERALKDQEKAERRERQIQTLQQTTNLITASSKIWKDFGFPLAIPFITLMFGSFLATKIKAGQVARKEYAEGGSERFDYGGPHGSGKDIYLGKDKQGRERYAERGEVMGIYSRKAVRKYGYGLIDQIIDTVNDGTFESVFQAKNSMPAGANIFLNAPGTDMSTTERELRTIRKQNERKVSYGPNGMVEIYGQNTRIYK